MLFKFDLFPADSKNGNARFYFHILHKINDIGMYMFDFTNIYSLCQQTICFAMYKYFLSKTFAFIQYHENVTPEWLFWLDRR